MDSLMQLLVIYKQYKKKKGVYVKRRMVVSTLSQFFEKLEAKGIDDYRLADAWPVSSGEAEQIRWELHAEAEAAKLKRSTKDKECSDG